MAALLVGTVEGLHRVGDDATVDFGGRRVTAIARTPEGGHLLVLDGRSLWRSPNGGGWAPIADIEGPPATCVVGIDGGALVGTGEAHLLQVDAEGRTRPVAGFESAEGRDGWYTP